MRHFIIQTHFIDCRDGVAAGRLVKLFGGQYASAHTLYAIYQSRRLQPARIRCFLDFLVDNMPAKL